MYNLYLKWKILVEGEKSLVRWCFRRKSGWFGWGERRAEDARFLLFCRNIRRERRRRSFRVSALHFMLRIVAQARELTDKRGYVHRTWYSHIVSATCRLSSSSCFLEVKKGHGNCPRASGKVIAARVCISAQWLLYLTNNNHRVAWRKESSVIFSKSSLLRIHKNLNTHPCKGGFFGLYFLKYP